MLRCKDQIRLTLQELEVFRRDTGVMTPPATVQEYNQGIQDRADHLRQTVATPEAIFLAELIEADKVSVTGYENHTQEEEFYHDAP